MVRLQLIFPLNYRYCFFLQHVTPKLSLGGEVFWIGQQRRSGVGYVARYETDQMVNVSFSSTLRFTMLLNLHNILLN